jgi:hypothetical protein
MKQYPHCIVALLGDTIAVKDQNGDGNEKGLEVCVGVAEDQIIRGAGTK